MKLLKLSFINLFSSWNVIRLGGIPQAEKTNHLQKPLSLMCFPCFRLTFRLHFLGDLWILAPHLVGSSTGNLASHAANHSIHARPRRIWQKLGFLWFLYSSLGRDTLEPPENRHELRTNLPLPTCSMEKYRSDLFEKKRYIKKTTHLRRKKGPLHSTCACSIDLPNDHAPRWYAARPPAKALHLSRFSTYRARAPKRCQFCTFKRGW